jgi:hypothetical protein
MSQLDVSVQSSDFVDPHELILARLAAPFPNVKRRTGQGNQVMEYIDAPMMMNRLDDVVGPWNWEDDYTVIDTCVYCKITITFSDGERRTRGDCSAYDERKDPSGKPWPNSKVKKTAFSDAFKRAGVKWGIGRYLKNGGKQANYYRRIAARAHAAPDPPAEPDGPRGSGKTSEPPGPEEFPSRPHNPARPGVALFKLLSTEEYKRVHGLDRAVEFGAENSYPQKVIDWNHQQVITFCEANDCPVPPGVAVPGRAEKGEGA